MPDTLTLTQVLEAFSIPEDPNLFTFYPGYADTSNDDCPNGVIVADWNELPDGLDSALEKAGYAVDWADSTGACDNCGKLCATQPQHAWWQPYYRWFSDRYPRRSDADWEGNGDGPMVCLDCLKDEGFDWLEQFEDNPAMLNTAHTVNPGEFDYEKIDSFETDPCERWQKDMQHIAVFGRHSATYKGLVFHLDKSHDTYMEVSLWARKGEYLEAVQAEIETELDKLMETSNAAYQQILLRPFRPEEYSIVEAKALLSSLKGCE